jgi:hypothetical protein
MTVREALSARANNLAFRLAALLAFIAGERTFLQEQ